MDNTIIDELRKGDDCRVQVRDWYQSIHEGDVWLSVLVIGHMCKSLELLRQKDAERAEFALKGIKELGDRFYGRILPITKQVAAEWGHISAGTTLPTVLGLHAATARAHGMTLATIHDRAGELHGVRIVDPIRELGSLVSIEDDMGESAPTSIVVGA